MNLLCTVLSLEVRKSLASREAREACELFIEIYRNMIDVSVRRPLDSASRPTLKQMVIVLLWIIVALFVHLKLIVFVSQRLDVGIVTSTALNVVLGPIILILSILFPKS